MCLGASPVLRGEPFPLADRPSLSLCRLRCADAGCPSGACRVPAPSAARTVPLPSAGRAFGERPDRRVA